MDAVEGLVLAGAVVAFAGFVLLVHTTGNAPVLKEPGPERLMQPSAPERWNTSTAARYAAMYEEAYLHNDVLERREEATRVDAVCLGSTQNATRPSFFVEVRCGYTWEQVENGQPVRVDGTPYTIQYEVTPNYTRRFDRILSNTTANQSNTG